MPPSLEQEIRDAVLDYVSGAMPVRQFQEWFASRTWDVDADDDVLRLLNEIDLLLAEFSNGDWTESELKSNLQQYRRTVQVLDVAGTVFWTEVRPPYVYTMTNGAGGYDGNMRLADVPLGFDPRIEQSATAA